MIDVLGYSENDVRGMVDDMNMYGTPIQEFLSQEQYAEAVEYGK